MTWHQWHQTAPMSSRIGLSSARARAKASSPHSYQLTGWCAAERRYGLAEWAKRPSDFSPTVSLPGRSLRGRATPAASLDGMFGSGIVGVNRLASGEPFILAVPEANAVFTQPPAEINFLVVDDRGKIH